MVQLSKIIYDFSNYNIDQNFDQLSVQQLLMLNQFICIYYQAWIDSDNNLYVQQEYCEYGDILDYLSAIESQSSNILSENFYWDLIFEMLCVSIKLK